MVQPNEAIMLLLGIGTAAFLLLNRRLLGRLPESKILFWGYGLLLLGWILTILEGFFWKETVNIIEHMCYAGSTSLVALWCMKTFLAGGKQE